MHKDTFVKQQRWSIKYIRIIGVFACVCCIHMMRSMWSTDYGSSVKIHKTWLQLSLPEAELDQEAEVGLPALALVPGSGVRGLHCLCEASWLSRLCEAGGSGQEAASASGDRASASNTQQRPAHTCHEHAAWPLLMDTRTHRDTHTNTWAHKDTHKNDWTHIDINRDT